MASKILVIDDDPNVAELIKLILKPRGLLIYHAINGQEGLKLAYELQPDLVILDIMMPEHDGFEICARLRELSDVPIVMLTAKSQSSDVTRGFAVGADDYVKKPFSNDELVSRIESLLRRKKSVDASTNITGYSDGILEVEFASQKITLFGEEITLTPTEFKLLAYLIRHPQKTLSARALLHEVWGDAYSHDKALLSLYIHQLRQKLKDGETEHSYIRTHWGQGYWFNSLLQPDKPSLESTENEQIREGLKIPTRFFRNKWVWLVLGGLFILLAFVVLQKNITLAIAPNHDKVYTSLDAQMTAEGFMEPNATGVRGQICVKNTGEHPTENLSIVNSVQISSKTQVKYTSSTVDLSDKPVLDPDERFCYPFEIGFEPLYEQNARYQATTTITITNHLGRIPGSKDCLGTESCPFGLEIATDLILPEQ